MKITISMTVFMLGALGAVGVTACAAPADGGGDGGGNGGGGCTAGASSACTCPGGGSGAQLCKSDGTLAACDCGGAGGSGGGGTSDCAAGCDKLTQCLAGTGDEVGATCVEDCDAGLADASFRAETQACLDCTLGNHCDRLFPTNGSDSACKNECGYTTGCVSTDPIANTVDDCTGESICIGDACEAAFGRFYTIGLFWVTMNQRDDNGDAWDALGGLPDPFVVVTLNGTEIGSTAYSSDTLEASFTEAFDAQIAAGSTLEINVWDADDTVHDFAFGCRWEPLGADSLRWADLYCESPTGNIVQAAIYPR